jgi:hypothetical protein
MTMLDQVNATTTPRKRLPWNKGKLTGAKPPLRPKHVWSIRTKLQIDGRVRDLAMFNLAIEASSVAVTSSLSGSRTSLQMDIPRIARRFDRRRPDDLSGSS